MWHDLRLIGTSLGDYEGALVTVLIGHPDRPPERLGSARVRVVGGGLDLTFPQVLEWSLYKRKLVHIDANGSGACEPGEPMFSDSRAVKAALTLTLDTPTFRSQPATGPSCDAFQRDWLLAAASR